jgi:Leucine-rich repeat (LRR) protein
LPAWVDRYVRANDLVCSNLKELYLSENKLTSLDGLPLECSELTILDIAHNQLRSLSGVAAYPSLEDVWANTNQLRDLPTAVRLLDGVS